MLDSFKTLKPNYAIGFIRKYIENSHSILNIGTDAFNPLVTLEIRENGTFSVDATIRLSLGSIQLHIKLVEPFDAKYNVVLEIIGSVQGTEACLYVGKETDCTKSIQRAMDLYPEKAVIWSQSQEISITDLKIGSTKDCVMTESKSKF